MKTKRPLSRRDFLKLSSEMTLSTSMATILYSENSFAAFDLLKNEMSFSILQGATSDTVTQLTIDVPLGMSVQFRLIAASRSSVKDR